MKCSYYGCKNNATRVILINEMRTKSGYNYIEYITVCEEHHNKIPLNIDTSSESIKKLWSINWSEW